MKKNLVNLMCALLALFCSQAIAADQKAPLVCNAAETAKVCKGWSDETKLVLGGPDSDRFYSALADCAGPDNYGQQGPKQQLYIDCQNKADIDEVRLKANAVDDAKRRNFSWMQKRCSLKYPQDRVCGTSVDSTVSSIKDDSSVKNRTLTLTRTPDDSELLKARDAQVKEIDRENAKVLAQKEQVKAKEESARQASAFQKTLERRKQCMEPRMRGQCDCISFQVAPPGGWKGCGK